MEGCRASKVGNSSSIFWLLLGIGSFFIFARVIAASSDIVINEIAAYEPSGCEWIEVYNKGSSSVNMEGWKFFEDNTNHSLAISPSSTQKDWLIEAGEYAIIAQNDGKLMGGGCGSGYAPPAGTLFDSSWGTLNESGESVGLKDASGALSEQFTYLTASDRSLERKNAGLADYTSANWVEHASGNSFGLINSAVASNPTPTPTPTPSPTATTTPSASPASNPEVRLFINEILPNPNDSEHEWVELYNAGTANLNLTGYTLSDGAGVISSPTSTMLAGAFFTIEFSSSHLNNDGDAVILKNSSGDAADAVSFGNWNDGNAADNAMSPEKGRSIARKADGSDTNNDKNDFSETTTPTKGTANAITAPAASPSASPAPSAPTTSGPPLGFGSGAIPILPGDVVINELLSDPEDGEEEFVELYSNAPEPAQMTGWWLEDGSELKTPVEGMLPVRGFLAISRPRGNLNNDGDIVRLFNSAGQEIDRVAYGDWRIGEGNTAAPAPGRGASLSRAVDGRDTNAAADFVLSGTITRGKPNVITALTAGGGRGFFSPVILNELFPNPEGSDERDEWIELLNVNTSSIELAGWKLVTGAKTEYSVPTTTLPSGAFLLFKRSETRLVLRNDGETVRLLRPDGTAADQRQYAGEAKAGASFSRNADGKWQWTLKPTPGADNAILAANQPPVIALDAEREAAAGETVQFDASDTVDPDGGALVYRWDFGDGATDEGMTARHAYARAGSYRVALVATDAAGGSASLRVTIRVKNRSEFIGGIMATDPEALKNIRITEIYPNPEDSETEEFIELINEGEEDADLSGLKLDDEEGGSRAYNIPNGAIMRAGDILVFERKETKIALNNGGDSARLLGYDGAVLEAVAYGKAPEGASYVKNEKGEWVWTGAVTHGEKNVINMLTAKNTKIRNAKGAKDGGNVIQTIIAKARLQDIGDRVQVTGVVSAPPGLFGAQYMYLADGSRGVPVYFHKKDWPRLAVGDTVSVEGELAEYQGDIKVKIKSASDMRVRKKEKQELSAAAVAIADIDENALDALIKVAGEITQKRSGFLYVDDGSDEMRVTVKRNTGIITEKLHEGDKVEVAGILRKIKEQWELWPRSQDDIQKQLADDGAIARENKKSGAGLGSAEKYLEATAGGLTALLASLLARGRGAVARAGIKRAGAAIAAIIRRKPPSAMG